MNAHCRGAHEFACTGQAPKVAALLVLDELILVHELPVTIIAKWLSLSRLAVAATHRGLNPKNDLSATEAIGPLSKVSLMALVTNLFCCLLS